MIDHFTRIAGTHRAKATAAESNDERIHWEAEATRFEDLALLASINPETARAAYRPTRAYQPTA